MKKLLSLSIAILISCHAVAAQTTQESIDRLFVLAKIDSTISQTVESSNKNLQQMSQQMMQQFTVGKSLTPSQQKFMDAAMQTTVQSTIKLFHEEFTFEKLRAQYAQAYRETFTQKEIDDLSGFYESPVGQSFASKMTIVDEKFLAVRRAKMQAIVPKMMEIIQNSVKDSGLQK